MTSPLQTPEAGADWISYGKIRLTSPDPPGRLRQALLPYNSKRIPYHFLFKPTGFRLHSDT
ncbi:hypothetical protein ABGV42_23520 [Paenibacillus pabuli]|uniref:hypothetical protein n=1 Tax=Paenibacillus pabuli TaxID=1472 RepID=UPI003242E6B8